MELKDKIYTIRNQQVILDRDLAELYAVETRYLNKVVRRNVARFPEQFMFQLSESELKDWKFQFGTSNNLKMGLRKHPFVFTEQGVSMLAGILRSNTAIKISIQIINAFVTMRHFLIKNENLFQKFQQIDQKFIEYDTELEAIFKAIESKQITPSQGIFYDGQIYDAYIFIVNLIKTAKNKIIIIDNYIDDSILTLLSNKLGSVRVTIYTKTISKQLELAKDKFNEQYNNLNIIEFNKAHDRFIIIDNITYHIGASLKDLGKKWFAFSKLKDEIKILDKLAPIPSLKF